MTLLLDLKDVTVMRGAGVGLRGLTLSIAVGERVCVLGPNGSGKSTLLKTMTRECYPVLADGSSMAILGKTRWDVFELRAQLGIVSPDVLRQCTGEATGRDVVLSGFFSSTQIFPHHRPSPDLLHRTDLALARAGVRHLSDRAVSQMSTGEAKRTLIARALVHEPHTLVFDEPGTALDIAAQKNLSEMMRELARQGVGILLVTHHVAEIIPEIDRVILLRGGEIVLDDRKERALTAENLESLFGVSIRLVSHDGYFYIY